MSFFRKVLNGLTKTRQAIVSQIDAVVNSFTKIDDDFFDELEELLILADVGSQSAEDICNALRQKIKETGEKDKNKIKSLLRDILAEKMGKDEKLKISTKPSIILMIGVNGVGKTTTIGKLAYQLKSEGKNVLLVAADTFRAAAIDQLSIWAERANVDIVRQNEGSDPAAVVFDGISAAKNRNIDVIICDTAGRLHNKKHLMDELAKINRIINRELPEADKEVLLVLDATTGQNAINQAQEFQKVTDLTGIVLTKLDGTAKGGVVFAVKDSLGLAVKYIGLGEQMDDLQPFNAKDFVRAFLPESENDSEYEYLDDTKEHTGFARESFVVATNNKHKLDEIKAILEPLDIDVKTCEDMGINLDNIVENGSTYEENAKIKAEYVYNKIGVSVIADDSGLNVDALNGEPGVFSARYAGEAATDAERIDKLLLNLGNTSDRSAHFETCIYCILANGERIIARGQCYGNIAYSPRGDNGFGYDPVFVTSKGKTFAELSNEEKNSISHRGIALKKFEEILREKLLG